MKYRLIIFLGFVLTIVLPVGLLAAGLVPDCGGGPCKFSDLFGLNGGANLASSVVTFMIKDIAIPVVILMFVWAGLVLVTGGSKEASHKKAKDIFWAAIVGLVITLAAYLIVKLVVSALVEGGDNYKLLDLFKK